MLRSMLSGFVVFCFLNLRKAVLVCTSRSNLRVFCYQPPKSGICKTHGTVGGQMFKNVEGVLHEAMSSVCFIWDCFRG